jgi:hypothetical protein
VTSPTAIDELYVQAVLWLVDERGLEPVVRAACDALVAGLDGAELQSLAALSVHSSSYDSEVDQTVRAALAEQGRPLPPRGSDEATEAAVRAMAREALRGRWIPRELAAWAHRVIGHSGPALAQPLVNLDDCYDALDYSGDTEADLDAQVLSFCGSVVTD